MTQKTNPWTFDVRVRERNLKAGTITDKDVEKYVSGLPDLVDQSEAFATSQPALLQPVVAEEEFDDEDEDEDDEVEVEAAAAVAAAPAAAPVAAAPAAAPAPVAAAPAPVAAAPAAPAPEPMANTPAAAEPSDSPE
jgi:hypothetical protein